MLYDETFVVCVLFHPLQKLCGYFCTMNQSWFSLSYVVKSRDVIWQYTYRLFILASFQALKNHINLIFNFHSIPSFTEYYELWEGKHLSYIPLICLYPEKRAISQFTEHILFTFETPLSLLSLLYRHEIINAPCCHI